MWDRAVMPVRLYEPDAGWTGPSALASPRHVPVMEVVVPRTLLNACYLALLCKYIFYHTVHGDSGHEGAY